MKAAVHEDKRFINKRLKNKRLADIRLDNKGLADIGLEDKGLADMGFENKKLEDMGLEDKGHADIRLDNKRLADMGFENKRLANIRLDNKGHEEKGMGRKISDRVYTILAMLLFACFLPVLLCVVFVGTHMDYWEAVKVSTRLPNPVLLAIALPGMAVCMFLFRKCAHMRFTAKSNWIADGVLFCLYFLLFLLNIRVAKEIAFHLPTDYMMVSGVAYKVAKGEPVGPLYYLSIYPNNIPISYILGKLYQKVSGWKDYPYIYEFFWLQVNCALISIAGFFSCLTVKKLTGKLMPVAAAFGLYLILAGISPWKIAAYTDTYSMVFPVLCVYFYFCYRDARHLWSKYVCLLLSIAAGMAGGLIKPSVYVVILALLGWELIRFLSDLRQHWKFLLPAVLMVLAFVWGTAAYRDHLIDKIGLEFNEELEAGWQQYFLMGLNEETTGAFNSDDALFGEFQDDRDGRIREELHRAAGRLQDRGFWGSIWFYLRKLVMTFNDGTFGWNMEIYIYDRYPDHMAGNTALTQRLRSIFWRNDMNYDVGGWHTLCQLVWIFSLLGIPGICLCRDHTRDRYGILLVSFLGIFFYQMLFEARARYLFCFLPLILPIAVCGIQQYIDALSHLRSSGQEQADTRAA